jgi:16S rRNA processing protein RimM
VEVLTDQPERRFARGAQLFVEGSSEPLTVLSGRKVADGPGWWLRFVEIPDRTSAERLRGVYLEAEVAAEDRPAGSYWWHEVVGCRVRDLTGRDLGAVREVYRAGEREVYVVDGGAVGEWDLPAVAAFIPVFAPERGEIVVDAVALDLPPPGAEGGRRRRPPGGRSESRGRRLRRVPVEGGEAIG